MFYPTMDIMNFLQVFYQVMLCILLCINYSSAQDINTTSSTSTEYIGDTPNITNYSNDNQYSLLQNWALLTMMFLLGLSIAFLMFCTYYLVKRASCNKIASGALTDDPYHSSGSSQTYEEMEVSSPPNLRRGRAVEHNEENNSFLGQSISPLIKADTINLQDSGRYDYCQSHIVELNSARQVPCASSTMQPLIRSRDRDSSSMFPYCYAHSVEAIPRRLTYENFDGLYPIVDPIPPLKEQNSKPETNGSSSHIYVNYNPKTIMSQYITTRRVQPNEKKPTTAEEVCASSSAASSNLKKKIRDNMQDFPYLVLVDKKLTFTSNSIGFEV